MSPPRVGWPAKNDYTTLPPANTLRTPGIPLHQPLRRDRDSANRVPRDRLRDETRSLHVLGELTQISRAGGRPCGVPTDCCTAVKRPSSTRDPGSFAQSVASRGLSPESTSSLSLTKISYEASIPWARTSCACLRLRLWYRS